jgi:hypothetical protein
MISRNLLFIILMAVSATLCYSNADCVIEAFDLERQEVGMAQAAKLAEKSAAEARTPKANPNNGASPKHKETFMQWAKGVYNDITGTDDPRLVPSVSYSRIVDEYLHANTDFLSAEGKNWITQQCKPYVDTKFNDVARSDFICTKLYVHAQEEVAVLESLKGFAFHPIGRLLKKAAGASKPSAKEELKKETFAVFQSDLNNGRRKVRDFHGDLLKRFMKNFKEEYQSFISLLDNDTEKCNLRKIVTDLLPQQSKQAVTVLRAVYALEAKGAIKITGGNCQIIQNVLVSYSRLLSESSTSLAFVRIGDLIISTLNNKRSVVNLESNILFPMCISAVAVTSDQAKVSKLSACKQVLTWAMNIQLPKASPLVDSHFAVNVLESPEFVALFENTLALAANTMRQSGVSNFDKFVETFKKTWVNLLENPRKLLDDNTKFEAASGLSRPIFLPLIISLQDLLQTEGVNPASILTPQFFSAVRDATAKTVFAATSVTDFIETFKTATIKTMGQPGKKIKLNHFRRKLSMKCQLMPEAAYQNVCKEVARTIHAEGYLHYRYLDPIFDLIVDRVSDKLKGIVIGSSQILDVVEIAKTGVKNLLVEFAEELREFTEVKPDLVESHTPVKAMMYLLAAKTVFMDTSQRLPSSVYEHIANFIVANSESLHHHKIRHFEFDRLMRQLQSLIATKTAQSAAESKLMKGSQLEHVDDHIKAFAMTSAEKAVLRDNLAVALRPYASFSFEMQKRLDKCKLNLEEIDKAMDECQGKHNRLCSIINPFIIMAPCPSSYFIDSEGFCYPRCPDSFTEAGIQYCRKPIAQLVESRSVGAHKEYTCLPGFIQEGVLCIPRCPVGWKSLGDLCERPVLGFDYSTEIVLVR